MLVGCDAGSLNREPGGPAPAVVTGYELPRAHVKLEFESETDAYLAAEIIEWRIKNAPSMVTRELTGFERFKPQPFDHSEVSNGILVHRFDEPTAAHRVRGMLLQYDVAIYGWGEYS